MDLNNLRDVYHEQLKDMYSAEKQQTEALPELAEAASSPALKTAFLNHLEITQRHFELIERYVDLIDVNPGNTKCEAMEGLVEEAKTTANKDGDRDARDAALICAAQKAEHYEIASYGSLRTWAQMLGEEKAARLLQEILNDEYEADNILDRLAEGFLNQEAKQ